MNFGNIGSDFFVGCVLQIIDSVEFFCVKFLVLRDLLGVLLDRSSVGLNICVGSRKISLDRYFFCFNLLGERVYLGTVGIDICVSNRLRILDTVEYLGVRSFFSQNLVRVRFYQCTV